MRRLMVRSGFLVALAIVAFGRPDLTLRAQSPDASVFGEMAWRLVGPHRAGRISFVAGVPGDPSIYYLATPAGALWKTTSGGTTWASISDALPVTGFGVVAVASSNHDVVYAGSGQNLLGRGLFRSNDAGATWQSAGLADTKYLTGLVIDPDNPDVVVAAAGSGGNFGSMVYYNNNPSPTRGIYRTTDGGRTWAHTLFIDAATSVVDLVSDPAAPRVIFASMSGGANSPAGPPIYRTTDEGVTWQRLPAAGLPANATSANIAVAPGTEARRLYALVGGRGAGMYRSDDGGATFVLMTTRLASASGRIYVDPKNPDVVYTMGTSMYRSIDGGRTFAAEKGAPGGDDPRSMWIDPTNPRRMILGEDQGPAISMNGGATWSPWFNLPNGELYFVSTDRQFPYWIYAAQQDSGSVTIKSRSDFGAIRPSDWYPVSGYEQGHIFGDPLDARYVYAHGGGHAIIKFDRVTGQSGPVFTPVSTDRFGPRPGFELSRKDPRWMFYGAQYVMASSDRVSWTRISPDFPGTVVALAPSPLDVNLLWAGTSTGVIELTRDAGKTWTNVSPPRFAAERTLVLWSMEASSHDAAVAYASAIDLSDRHAPALFMTSDFGASWREIVGGLPADVPTRVVREDPQQANLLYAGTQAGAFVSFDRGGHWQSLQLNLPRAAVNDITVHDADLVIATWGRALWALDDVTPLRQMSEARASATAAFLYSPLTTTRVRWDNNQDTPLPPEVPQGQNPPDGAIIDYYLKGGAPSAAIAILDSTGAVVRGFTSAPPTPDTSMPNVPDYWFKQPDVVKTTPGMHRLVWDLRYATPPSLNYGADGEPSPTTSYGIIAAAIIGQTPRQQPVGSLVLPGTYQVRLTVGSTSVSRPLTIVNDPRSPIGEADLRLQWQEERALAAGIATSHDAIERVRALRDAARARIETGAIAGKMDTALAAFTRAAAETVVGLAGNRSLAQHLAALEFADLKPTASTLAALRESCGRADAALARYRQFVNRDLATFNAALTTAGAAPLPAPAAIPATACVR